MPRDRFDYSHGDSGTKPSGPLDFRDGKKPEPEYFDWLWSQLVSKINLVFDELDRLDSDDDGVVDRADYADDANATTYKGTDIDSDGDGKVDTAQQADNASTLQGLKLQTDDGWRTPSVDAVTVTAEPAVQVFQNGSWSWEPISVLSSSGTEVSVTDVSVWDGGAWT